MGKRLQILKQNFAVCKLKTSSSLLTPIDGVGLWSLSLTNNETSLVCPIDHVPKEAEVETGWRAFMVVGPLDFSLTGILSNLSVPLANAGIPIFVISTFDTDYLLVKEAALKMAQDILSKEWQIIE